MSSRTIAAATKLATRGLLRHPSPSLPILRLRGLATMSVADAFKKESIVPEVVPEAPKDKIEVKFASGAEVSLGNELKPRAVKDQPNVVSWPAEAGALYTLIMTDPDAPSRKEPKFREWHHWLVANIPGTDIAKGSVLAQYIGSGPPKDTDKPVFEHSASHHLGGLHRYVYLVYKQAGPIEDKEHGVLTNRSGDGRGCFKAADFAKKHNLTGPVAGNFYQAQWDDYVPELYKQLGAA